MHPVRALLDLPRRRQAAALSALRHSVDVPTGEGWNTRFGPTSLFDAWTRTTLMTQLYAANRAALAPVVTRRPFRIVEIGGGNGRLWEGFLPPEAEGELVVVDPMPDVHAEVARVLPPGVRLTPIHARVEDAHLPVSDAVVCSLTLHHVAGADALEREHHGLVGPGKLEVLRQLAASVRPRQGFIVLNEADVYCDLALAPGDPVLEDQLLDSYVRRCAHALLDDLAAAEGEEARRLDAILWRWCVDQVALAHAPREQRDVYELDVSRWLALFRRAELRVTERRFTDDFGLFCQYLLAF